MTADLLTYAKRKKTKTEQNLERRHCLYSDLS